MRVERSDGWTLAVRRGWGLGALIVAALALPAVGVLAGVALAASAFEDVDPGGVHAVGIEWLAESGVTAGCAAGRFCPGDAVTREQMGTFLYRLSGHDPQVGPSVNASTVQGVTVQELFDAFMEGELPELPGVPPPSDPQQPGPPDEDLPDDPDGESPDGGNGQLPDDPGDPDQDHDDNGSDGEGPDPELPGGDDPDGDDSQEQLAALEERVGALETDLEALELILGELLDVDLDDPEDTVVATILDLRVRLGVQEQTTEQIEEDLTAEQGRVDALEDRADRLDQAVGVAESERQELIARFAGVTRQQSGGRATLRFEGMNVQLVNGAPGARNGLGNLIVGYNAGRTNLEVELEGPDARTGSHNLVLGEANNYTALGGLVAGRLNEASADWASVLGGSRNHAAGPHAVVLGGWRNEAGDESEGSFATVTGGAENRAEADYASVSGGWRNLASGDHASVSGGRENIASGQQSAVSGGIANEASALRSAVSGGSQNKAQGTQSTVSGGQRNEAAGNGGSVSGGQDNTAFGTLSSVSGGRDNIASGLRSSVLGGSERNLSGEDAIFPSDS